MSDLVPLPVVGSKLVARNQVLLTLDGAGTTLPASHSIAGQYAKLSFDGDVARPFAIASAPGRTTFEFLLKVSAERVASLLALGVDDRVAMSAAQGRGFPLSRAEGQPLLLCGVGSGIAPLRAVVEQIAATRTQGGPVTLLYGVRHVDEFAFSDRFAAWAGLNVQVIPVVSRPDASTWAGRTGHVQDHLPAAFAAPERLVVFVCGLPEMEKAVAAALLARGVGAHQIFRNW